MLAARGVDTSHVEIVDGPSGHAIIQVDRAGENAILLAGGANQTFTAADAANLLQGFGAGDWLLLQNEINAIPDFIRAAAARGLHIAFNPAPMTPAVHDYPLDLVNLLIVNEIEGAALSGETDPDAITTALRARYPSTTIVLTLGADGVCLHDAAGPVTVPAPRVDAVDTTAAGDCFIGYLLAGLLASQPVRDALRRACAAAAICVTRPGAAPSIPLASDVP
jgi:ribokinase